MKFLKNNIKTIITHILLLSLFFWMVFILTPKVEMSYFDYSKIDKIDSKINEIKDSNLKLEENIDSLNSKINRIDEDILNIQKKKDIVKEYYYEKIKGVDSLSIPELDSFFTERYGK